MVVVHFNNVVNVSFTIDMISQELDIEINK